MFGATGFSAAPFGAGPATGPIGVSGLAATGGVGSASINGDADAVVTGLQATSGLGQVLFSIGVNGISLLSISNLFFFYYLITTPLIYMGGHIPDNPLLLFLFLYFVDTQLYIHIFCNLLYDLFLSL